MSEKRDQRTPMCLGNDCVQQNKCGKFDMNTDSIDLNDFKVPTGGILKVLEDAFDARLPILRGHQLVMFEHRGELLGRVNSDLAKRFLTASIQFAIAATSPECDGSIDIAMHRVACSKILGHLGWRIVGADIPACAGKALVLGSDWNVYAVSPFRVVDGDPILVDYTPKKGSFASEFMRKLSAILRGHGDALKLPVAPQFPVGKGENVIATIDDPRFRYILDLSHALTIEFSDLQKTEGGTGPHVAYYESLITHAAFIIEAAVHDVLPEEDIVDWQLRQGGVIVELAYTHSPGCFAVCGEN